METENLVRFIALAEKEHLTSTAAELNTTQPTLSRALGRLEQQLGVPLFDRRGKRLYLNEFGRIFLQHACHIVDELALAQARLGELADPSTGQVRLAFVTSLGSWVVSDLLGPYRQLAPAAHFSLRDGSPATIVDYLGRRLVDFIVTTKRPTEPEISWRSLRRERLYLLVSKHHPLAPCHSVDLSDAVGERFIVAREPALREITDRLCANAGFEPAVAFDSTDINVTRGLVAANFGVAIAPRSHVHSEPDDLAYVRLEDPDAFRELGLAWTTQDRWSPAASQFHDFVLSLTTITQA